MGIDLNTKQAYSELDEFLDLLDEETRNEVPEKIREFFKREKDSNYHKKINPDIPIEEQNLKKETLALIALLNLQYWCKDEHEKQRLKNIYIDNEKKYQEQLRKKYNPDHIFKKSTSKMQEEEEQAKLTKYEKSAIKKILKKFLKFIHRNG